MVRNLEFTEYFSCGKGHSELRVLIEAKGKITEVRIHTVVEDVWARDGQKR